jgi:hypothetical protein
VEYACGNIFVRQCEPMQAGTGVLGHRHNFDHMTHVQSGVLEISVLRESAARIDGTPLEADVLETRVIRADDEVNWMLIMKGRFHILRALEDGTRYQCIYAHRAPQALTVGEPGQRDQQPYAKRDEDGALWLRVDESIVQDTAGWADAYR